MKPSESKIVRYVVDLTNPPALSEEQQSRLKTLSEKPDSEIDYSDIPPLGDDVELRRINPSALDSPSPERTINPMSTHLDPLVSEFETQEQADAYDVWYCTKVQEAIDSKKPRIPHDQVMAEMWAVIDQHAQKRGNA